MFFEDKADFIASFDEYDPVIIDDLEVERSTEYVMEQMFFVVDSHDNHHQPETGWAQELVGVNHKTMDCFAGRRIPVWRKKNHIKFMRNSQQKYDKIDKTYWQNKRDALR